MLLPLPYHLRVRDHFRQKTRTWDFFASAKARQEQLLEFRTALLKNTYKFHPDTDKNVFAQLHTAQERLGLQSLPVHVYQTQLGGEANAGVVYLENEAHIVFSGQLLRQVSDSELLAILAHELSHVKLYAIEHGELEVTGRIITAIANSHTGDAAYYETARLYHLYTEIYCDRGALEVTGDAAPVITSLVKAATGLETVHADSFLRQADEIFALDAATRSAGISHPENFIRAKALQLWAAEGTVAEARITAMIEGARSIDELDIFRQQELADHTRHVLQLLLKPKWYRTALVTGLARQYFLEFQWDEAALLDKALVQYIAAADATIRQYLAYVLLDFVLCDPALELVPLGRVLGFAEDLQLKDELDTALKKEQKLSAKKLQQRKEEALAAYHEVKENESEQIYE